MSKFVKIYLERDALGKIPSVLKAVYTNNNSDSLGFMSNETPNSIWEFLDSDQRAELGRIVKKDEPNPIDVGMSFLQAVKQADLSVVAEIVGDHFNPNFQHPETGCTALHYIAMGGSTALLRELLKADELLFLVKNRKGQLPSVLALAHNDDPVVARYLQMKESAELRAGKPLFDFDY